MKNLIEFRKKLVADPSKVVPGAKELAAYTALAQGLTVGIWEATSVDALMPLLEPMTQAGYNGEIIPVEKMDDALSKLEKFLAQ